MFWFKSCSRCITGDLYSGGDEEKRCLQCGHVQYGDQSKVSYSQWVDRLENGQEDNRWASIEDPVLVDLVAL